MTLPAAPDILRQAAAVIERNGWHQGDLYDRHQYQSTDISSAECRVCAYGALNTVLYGHPSPGGFLSEPEEPRVHQALIAAKRELGITASIPIWQDEPDRTVDDVLGLFHRAAELAEAGESR